MKPKNLLSVRDLTSEEIEELFKKTKELKRNPRAHRPLVGKTLGLLFQKPSVRTRVSFEVGMSHLGGQSLYIGPVETEAGKRESSKDLALVLSRYLDGIVARTFAHADIEEVAQYATVPVINGLSENSHPCQALADMFTIQEKYGSLKGIRMAYVGDGNNVCHSLMEAAALMGLHLSVATPAGYEPHPEVVAWAKRAAADTEAVIVLTREPAQAVAGVSVVYTDVWTSMGQEKEKEKRQKIFKPYQVNRSLMQLADGNVYFMHCLPAHRGEEVTDEVMDSSSSIVYDQAENRMHVQKAILLKLLGASL